MMGTDKERTLTPPFREIISLKAEQTKNKTGFLSESSKNGNTV
jgi:hypothetical protein